MGYNFKWKCDKCSDGTCYCERIRKEDDDTPPQLVMKNICLVAPTTFFDAEWIKVTEIKVR